ncbi:hypothetical protein B0I31_102690 [Saccharothrix carnea]|uniref:Uncharacterized protein n=1 Tax=Saccharothrix carnea TaxID=1280637 RepID=A0A2P8IGW5_SACCR|nr:hypothetical protein [Saccharothrix carnea]PSL57711.1 hypothetical protein B0I31_102690 [Saccharothrix carnea]
MSDLDWVPDAIDTTVPSVARTCDYLLGGAGDVADRAEEDTRVWAGVGREHDHLTGREHGSR